jgi:4'-phosphopantetheinyl transferase
MVDVFFCDMSALDDSYQKFEWEILSADERERAVRFRFERDRRMFVCCRATLRRLLADRTGTPAESLEFELGLRGKPFLTGGGIQFNASHAGHWFACAISTGGEIGMDIEHVRPLDDMLDLAGNFFAPVEVSRLGAIPENGRTRGFFECWTRKEAVIKATGEGLSRPLDSFEVTFGPDAVPGLSRLDDQLNPGWPMYSFDPAPQYIAALTSPDPIEEVRAIFTAFVA